MIIIRSVRDKVRFVSMSFLQKQKHEIEKRLEIILKDRVNNDPNSILQCFTSGCRITYNGIGTWIHQSTQNGPYADLFSSQYLLDVSTVLATWNWLEFDIISCRSFGNEVFARFNIELLCVTTGRKSRTEICGHYVFSGNLISEMTEFIDTALVEDMLRPFTQDDECQDCLSDCRSRI